MHDELTTQPAQAGARTVLDRADSAGRELTPAERGEVEGLPEAAEEQKRKHLSVDEWDAFAYGDAKSPRGAVPWGLGETLQLLADVRRTIVGEVRDAEGIEAVRAALSRLFEGFVFLRCPIDEDVDDFLARLRGAHEWLEGSCAAEPAAISGREMIFARPRAEAVRGYEKRELTRIPRYRREALEHAGKKGHRGVAPRPSVGRSVTGARGTPSKAWSSGNRPA